jgi:hypothetical protein
MWNHFSSHQIPTLAGAIHSRSLHHVLQSHSDTEIAEISCEKDQGQPVQTSRELFSVEVMLRGRNSMREKEDGQLSAFSN